MAASNNYMRGIILLTTVLGSFLRATILMFALFYAFPIYPLLVALYGIGALAAFKLRLGVEFDPMLIILGGVINIVDAEITWKKNMGDFVVWALNIGLSFAAHAAGAAAFLALNGNNKIPAGSIPTQVLPGGLGVHLLVAIILPLLYYIVFALTNVYSRDGYGAIPARFFTLASVGWIFFFIARAPIDYGLIFATYIAAGNFGPFGESGLLFLGMILALALAFGYYMLVRPVTRRVVKEADSRGDPVVLNHLIGFASVDRCVLPSQYSLLPDSKGFLDAEDGTRRRRGVKVLD